MFKLVVLFAFVAVAVASPVFLHTPLSYTVPTAVSHQSRTDVISKPVVAAYAAPAVAYAAPSITYAAPAVHYAAPAATSYQSRTDVVSKPVVASYAAYAAPVVNTVSAYAAAPVAYSGYSSPLAYTQGYGYAGKLGYGYY